MSRMIESQNYYQVLEVPVNAPQDEIHRAYLKARETYSNDNPALYSIFSKEEAQQLIKLIDEAYHCLSNNDARKKYDIALAVKKPETKPNFNVEAQAPLQVPEPAPSTEGYAKTKISTYKINEQMDAQIKDATEITGSFLRKVREYKNISIESLCEFTRIGRHYLIALEEENYSALPATVFVRGFISQLAKLYNLNEKKACDYYMQRLKEKLGK